MGGTWESLSPHQAVKLRGLQGLARLQLLSRLTYPALHPELYLGCFEEAGDAQMGQCKAPKGRWG